MLQDSPGGQAGTAQQRPSTQLPDWHWAPLVHPWPGPPVGVAVGLAVAAMVAVGVKVTLGRRVSVAVAVTDWLGVAVAVG
jgi:hypothetical protein